MAISRKVILSVLSGAVIAYFILSKIFAYPSSVIISGVRFEDDRVTATRFLVFDAENLTYHLERPTIMIKFRREQKNKFAPDPQPIYSSEMLISLFPKEKRQLRHELHLATGTQWASLEVRPKRWFDF